MMTPISDSDVSSFSASSPCRSSPPLYYAESPSRDSHDGDKSSSRGTIPVYKCSFDSPSYLSHSRSSSASRVSEPFSLESAGRDRRWRRLNVKGWIDYSAIEENAYYKDYEDDDEGLSVVFKVLLVMAAFVLVCAFAGFIIWRVSRQYVPEVTLESMSVKYMYVGIGQDHTGVPTKMVSISSTVEMNVFNPAPYFGIHVTFTHATLFYYKIAVAATQLEEFYLPKRSQETKFMTLKGDQVPLYGASLSLDLSRTPVSAPMTLSFDITTQGNILGFLVKVKTQKHISCKVVIDSNNSKPIKLSHGQCEYFG